MADLRIGASGVDVGSSLIKVAERSPEGGVALRLLPRHEMERLAEALDTGAQRLGLTGAGAATLAQRLSRHAAAVDEFSAWRRGAERLLRQQGRALQRYLLVSLGTGTSALLVDGPAASRIGGTALGGGTILGLGTGLTGISDFAELATLAREGDRRRVDLLVSEIGEVPLPSEATASAFAKLGRQGGEAPRPADIARAIMGLVGENVALLCAALARLGQVRHIVYGGNTLPGNPALRDILVGLTRLLGHEPLIPDDGEFAGALGALELAEEGPGGARR